MKKLILGVDAGNDLGKVVGPYGAISFNTSITKATELNVEEVFGEDDMKFTIDGFEGFAGTLAKYETRFKNTSMYGTNKAHRDTKFRVLLAIYRYIKHFDLEQPKSISIITGQPYVSHNKDGKEQLIKVLKGSHPVEIEGEQLTITINEVGVAPEGVGAYFALPHDYPNCKIIDVGSGTVNAISFRDYRVINIQSDTFNYGVEVMDHNSVVDGLLRDTTAKGWERNDRILVCGGTAGILTEKIKEIYPNAEILLPTLDLEDGPTIVLEPVFANAVGYYNLAKGTFK